MHERQYLHPEDLIGVTVKHYTLGEGEIVDVIDDSIFVDFSNAVREFQLNSDFDNHFFVSDKDAQLYIDMLILEFEKQRLVLAPLPSKAGERKFNVPNPITELEYGRLYGTNSRDIYKRCVDGMGFAYGFENEFGRQGALLYVQNIYPPDYSIWFLSNPLFREPTVIDKKNVKAKWIDVMDAVVRDNTLVYRIREIWLHEMPDRENQLRITFYKDGVNYRFCGVYKHTETVGRTRIFELIQNDFIPKD